MLVPLGLGTCDYPCKYRRRLKGFLGVERSYIRSHGSLLDQVISTVRGLRGMWVYVQANRCYLAIQHVLVDKRDMFWAMCHNVCQYYHIFISSVHLYWL